MRIAIFCFCGPPLGAIVFVVASILPNIVLGHGPIGVTSYAYGVFFVFLFSYLPGFVPAIVTCQIDDYLSDKLSRWPRVAVTGLAGAIVTVAWLSLVMGQGRWIGWLALPIGVLPAAVCSWLSDRWAKIGADVSRSTSESGRAIDRA